jgi:ferredoxin-nitrite reductase
MLRIRIPGGLLPPASLRAIGEVSRKYGQGFAELSTRQNVQLHFISLPEVPAILDALADVGLTTAGACGDAVRNITGCPLEGVLADEAFDVTPVLEEASALFAGHPTYMDLPRKHKITVSACPDQCDMPEINDIGLIAAPRDGADGFAVKVGGGLSTAPRLARDLGVWVPVAEAVELLRALLDVWREDPRYRLSRVRARMKFLVDDIGPEALRAKAEERLGWRLEDGAAPEPRGYADHMGVHEQRQPGLHHVGVPVTVGIVDGDALVAFADLAEELGGDVRITKQQNLVLTGVPTHRLEEVERRVAEPGFPVDANPLRATAIACTGEPHCNYSVAETKGRVQQIVEHLEATWGDRLGGFRINLDGCPHACALHWVGDVGLMGTTSREVAAEGESRQAYDLFLRGGVGPLQAIGRPLVRRVPTARVEQALDGLIGAWLDGRATDDESFRDFCIRTPDDDLVSFATRGAAA